MLPNPTLFGVEIIWYSFFHYLGLVLSLIIGIIYYRIKYKGSHSTFELITLISFTIFLMLVGSRIAGMWEGYIANGVWADYKIILEAPSKGKFRWCGSVAALFVGIPMLGKLFRIQNYRIYLDVLAIALCVLTAITKQGCLFSGDGCYGIPTTLPWGMYFPYGPAPNILPVHPTPIYDGIFHLILFCFLLWKDKRKKNQGQIALIYFILVSFFYILLEIIRVNPRTDLGWTVPQIMYGIIFGISVLYLIMIYLTKRKVLYAGSQL